MTKWSGNPPRPSRSLTLNAPFPVLEQLISVGLGKNRCRQTSITRERGYSHEILDLLCKLGLEKGALGTKVTGGGMGGYMISLTPGKKLQETVATAFENEGYKVIRAAIGGS